MIKMKQDYDMTNRTGAIYAKNEIKLLCPIQQGMVYVKTELDNDVIDHTHAVYTKIRTKLSQLIGQDVVYHENQTW